VRGRVTSFSGDTVLAWLRHAGHEGHALDGISPPLRGWASDFGKTQSHQRSSPPLVRPPASGSLGSPLCPTARADGPSMAQRRSLGILPRDLDKRAHLGEQEGGKTQSAALRQSCDIDRRLVINKHHPLQQLSRNPFFGIAHQ
jgi:hypothetical protein